MPKFLSGKDYPWLCDECKAQVDMAHTLYGEGVMEDTDDEEAPCNFVYDNRLFCGEFGVHCDPDYADARKVA